MWFCLGLFKNDFLIQKCCRESSGPQRKTKGKEQLYLPSCQTDGRWSTERLLPAVAGRSEFGISSHRVAHPSNWTTAERKVPRLQTLLWTLVTLHLWLIVPKEDRRKKKEIIRRAQLDGVQLSCIDPAASIGLVSHMFTHNSLCPTVGRPAV